ncbi:MAG: hypothetical protein ACXVXC_14030 [Nocardioidaceae bacterium]
MTGLPALPARFTVALGTHTRVRDEPAAVVRRETGRSRWAVGQPEHLRDHGPEDHGPQTSLPTSEDVAWIREQWDGVVMLMGVCRALGTS